MKTAQLFAVAVITAASLPLMAQMDASAAGQQTGSANVGKTHVSDTASENAAGSLDHGSAAGSGALSNSASASGPRGTEISSNGGAEGAAATRGVYGGTTAGGQAFAADDMRPVSGQLESKLDAKSAKPGEPVIFKTTEKMKTADGTEIPKGTRLVGHVTAVQAHAKGHAESQLGIAFDRAELKGGRSIPIHSMIESVSPPPSAMMASSMSDDGGFAGGMGGGRVGGGAMMGGGVRGAGLLGGGSAVGGAAGGVVSTAGRVGSGVNGVADGTMGVAGNSLDATGRMAGGATGAATGGIEGLHGAAYGAGGLTAHATGIPGVMLRGDASGAASGMLSASGKNVHLDSGTQMVLGVAAAK